MAILSAEEFDADAPAQGRIVSADEFEADDGDGFPTAMAADTASGFGAVGGPAGGARIAAQAASAGRLAPVAPTPGIAAPEPEPVPEVTAEPLPEPITPPLAGALRDRAQDIPTEVVTEPLADSFGQAVWGPGKPISRMAPPQGGIEAAGRAFIREPIRVVGGALRELAVRSKMPGSTVAAIYPEIERFAAMPPAERAAFRQRIQIGTSLTPAEKTSIQAALSDIEEGQPAPPPAAIGMGAPEASPLYQAGTRAKAYAERTFAVDPAREGDIATQAAGMIGSMAPLVLGGPLSPAAAMAIGAGVFGLSSADEARIRAKEAGATDEQIERAADLNLLIGVGAGSIPLGVVLHPIARSAPGLVPWFANKLGNAVRNGVAFASVGEAQHWLTAEADKDFNPESQYHADANRVIASMATGAFFGGIHPAGPVRERPGRPAAGGEAEPAVAPPANDLAAAAAAAKAREAGAAPADQLKAYLEGSELLPKAAKPVEIEPPPAEPVIAERPPVVAEPPRQDAALPEARLAPVEPAVEAVPRTEISPGIERASASAREFLDGVGLQDVGLKVEQSMRDAAGRSVDGSYLKGLITLAMDDPARFRPAVLHEGIHAAREMGLFTAPEWAKLSTVADAWRKKYDIDRRYGDQFKATDSVGRERLREEAIAHAAADYYAGKLKPYGIARTLFERFRQLLDGMRYGFRQADLRDARAVFDAMLGGEMKGRGKPTEPPLDLTTAARREREALAGPQQGREEALDRIATVQPDAATQAGAPAREAMLDRRIEPVTREQGPRPETPEEHYANLERRPEVRETATRTVVDRNRGTRKRPNPNFGQKVQQTYSRLVQRGDSPYMESPKGASTLGLSDFVRQQGGILSTDPMIADLKQILDGKNPNLAMIRKKGVPMDYMRERAAEQGYLPMDSSLRDFLELFDQDWRAAKMKIGRRVTPDMDIDIATAHLEAEAHNRAVDDAAHQFGIDPTGLTAERFWRAVEESVGFEEIAAFHREIGEANARDYDRSARLEAEHGEPAALADLERINAEAPVPEEGSYGADRRAEQDGGGTARGEPADAAGSAGRLRPDNRPGDGPGEAGGDNGAQTRYSRRDETDPALDLPLPPAKPKPLSSDKERAEAGMLGRKTARREQTGDAGPLFGGQKTLFSRRDDPVETPAFKRWFSGSKIVDEAGKPLRVYHGSGHDIERFDASRGSSTTGNVTAVWGSFFTPSAGEASRYAGDFHKEGQNISPVYLAIRNPYEMSRVEWDQHAMTVFRKQRTQEEAIAAERKFRQELENQGHDGIIVRGRGFNAEYIAFRPEQIKSAIGNRGTFDAGDQRIAYARRPDRTPTFFSALSRAVDAMKQPRAPAGQWRAMLQNAKGVKAEEIKWSGVMPWLEGQKGPVTREQIADFLRENNVRVEEVLRGGKTDEAAIGPIERWLGENHPDIPLRELADVTARVRRGDAEGIGALEGYGVPDALMQPLRDSPSLGRGGPTKYGDRTLPGGENYRELLLTLPEARAFPPMPEYRQWLQEQPWFQSGAAGDGPKARELYAQATERNSYGYAEPTYRSSHFDEPNVLAHLRFNDRTDADGKRVLFIEEVQSDWHQVGRKRGYKGDEAALNAEHEAIIKERYDFLTSEEAFQMQQRGEKPQESARYADIIRRDDEIRRRREMRGTAVPDAPFKTTWHELAMKRALRYAAEHGYDKVAWTTGDQQAARYDLSKQVDYLLAKKNLDGTYRVSAQTQGRGHSLGDAITEARLEDFVGKDVAKKIADGAGEEVNLGANNQPRDVWRKLSGGDLKVGGEGMRGFYDKILPAFMQKYGKQWGARVGETRVEIGRRGERGETPTYAAPVHSVEITPAMRTSVMEQGQPLFARRPVLDRTLGDQLLRPMRALLRTAPMRRLVEADGFKPVEASYKAVRDNLLMTTAPMAVGTDRARVVAKKFANELRDVQFRYDQLDKMLDQLYKPAARKLMGRALDEQSVLEQSLRDRFAEEGDLGLRSEEANETRREWEQAGLGLARLTPDQRATVEMLNRMSERTWDRLREAGIVNGEALPYYMPRMLVALDSEGNVSRLGPEADRGASMEERSAPTGGDTGNVEQSGPRPLDPVGLNLTTRGPMRREHLTPEETLAAARARFGDNTELVTDIRALPLALGRNERAIAGRNLVDAVKELSARTGVELTSDVEKPGYIQIPHPAMTEWRPVLREDAEGGWRTIDDENGKPAMERRPIYIAEELEGPLRAVLSQPTGAVYNGLMAIKSGAMTTIMFSPLIHNMVEYGRAFPLMPGKMLTLGMYRDGYRAKQNPEIMREAIAHGYAPIGRSFRSDITGIAAEERGYPGRSIPARAVRSLTKRVASEDTANALARSIDKVGQFWHGTLLWDRIADLQAGIYVNMRDKYREKGFSQDAASTMAAHLANRYAGALPMESMSGMARKVANIALFSRSFTLGNVGVMKDMMNGMPRDVRAHLESLVGSAETARASSEMSRKATGAFMIDLALFYAGNAVLQSVIDKLYGDKDVDEIAEGYVRRAKTLMRQAKDNPLHILNPFETMSALSPSHENEPGKQERVMVGTGPDGRGIYVRNPFGKIGEEFKDYLTKPGDISQRKLSTLVRPLLQAWNNDQGFGRPIYLDDETIAQKAGRVVWHWMKSQTPSPAIEGAYDYASGSPEGDIGLWKAIGPLVGVQISRGHPYGPAASVEYDVDKKNRQSRLLAMPGITKLIKNEKIDEASARMEDIGMTAGEIADTIRRIENPERSAVRSMAHKRFQRKATDEQRDRRENVNR